ncbi:MAG TPA: response regulator [Polyangiaceae bacterium]|nr:response regulator [Polyangiaceae bacterium]
MRVSEAFSPPPVSQRQRSSARSELEAALFRALAMTARPFAAVGTSGIVLYWSAGARQLFGYPAEDIVGQSLSVTLPGLEQTFGVNRQALQDGNSTEFAARVLHRTGAPLDLMVCAAVAHNESGEVLATVLDFRPTSEALLPATTATVSSRPDLVHDLNNVLATIQIYAGLVGSSGLSDTQSADLQIALEAAREGSALLAAAAEQAPARADGAVVPVLSAHDVKDVVHQADEALRRALGGGVELSIQLPLGPLPVRAGREELEQLLLCLASNARDAMGGSGQLSLVVRNSVISEAHPLASEVPLGAHAVISVRDNGVGMSPATRARIFEPFFSTKPRGQGTGLGLTVALSTVKRLGGAIRVESEMGRGTEVQVFLPLALDPARAPQPDDWRRRATSLTVLLVEDDVNMRRGLRRALEAEGYYVLEAADGVEAGEVAARYPEPIQLLVTDLGLPRADGHDALARVRAVRPDIGAVFVSGQIDQSRTLPSGVELIQKPFATSELLAALARVSKDAPPDAGRLASKSPVVLIIDDDDELREAFGRVVEESEFVALRAKSGLHALQLLELQHVDVVICDQFMPGMDGVHLLELVRQRFPHCLRILFTAYPSSDVVLEAVNRGGVHKVLVKSMHAVAIRDEIERAVLASDRFRPKSP